MLEFDRSVLVLEHFMEFPGNRLIAMHQGPVFHLFAEIAEIEEDGVESVPVQADGIVAAAIEDEAVGLGADGAGKQVPETELVQVFAVELEILEQSLQGL